MRFRRTKPTPDQIAGRLEHCHECGAGVGVYERTCPSCGSSLIAEKETLLRALCDSGSMTPDAFDAAVRILETGAEEQVGDSMPRGCRQVGDIRPADLREFSVWEFALDEEGVEGQDEETVRPRPDLERVDPRDGMFVVAAEFEAADGTRFDGFVSPHEEHHVAYVQPTIVAGARHVRFWFGIIAPKPHVLTASYRDLGKSAKELFPLRYRSLVETVDGDVAGTIDGFMHYAAGNTDEIATIR